MSVVASPQDESEIVMLLLCPAVDDILVGDTTHRHAELAEASVQSSLWWLDKDRSFDFAQDDGGSAPMPPASTQCPCLDRVLRWRFAEDEHRVLTAETERMLR
jgi:hypothetical protein